MAIIGWRDFRLRGRRALAEWGLVSILTLLLVIGLSFSQTTSRSDFAIYDALVQLDHKATDDQIVIVAIDNRSLEELGRWPWSRAYHAAMLDRLSQAQPKAIGYDVLFLEPEDTDPILAQSITRAGNVYLPALFDTPGPNGQAWIIHQPVDALGTAAADIGHVQLTIDSDGLVRRLPLFVQTGSTAWPHLALQIARQVRGDDPHTRQPHLKPTTDLTVLKDEAISFHGGAGSYRTVSFVDVMRGEVPDSFLRDKLVLVGATAAGMGDRYATPLAPKGELMRGVEIQAAMLQTILDGSAIHALSKPLHLALSLLPSIVLLSGFLFLRPLTNMILGGGLMVLVLVISAVLFAFAKTWFAPTASLAGLILAYPLWSWRRLATASAYMQSELKAFELTGLSQHIPSFPIEDELRQLPSGDVVSRQVHALRATLHSLRAYERFTYEGLRSLPDATIISDNNGTIRLSNQKAEDMFGDLVGQGRNLDDLFESLGNTSWQNIVETDEAEIDDIPFADGRLLHPAASRLTESEDKEAGFILRLADITQVRAAERHRDYVVKLLTHDLRAPQTSILSLLAADPERQDPDANRRIAAYARQTLELAEGYVQLARAESQPVRSVIMDLVQVAMDAADTLWPQAKARGVTLRTPSSEHEMLFEGDESLMRRLILNLMDNALKYGPAGEDIDCTIETKDTQDGPKIIILVRDRGPGLTPAAVERLFQPFGQGGTETLGVGLGLAFVRTVAERHSGTVTYQAMHPGAGFIVKLPYAEINEESQTG